MAEPPIDPDAAIAVLVKTQSTQKQRIAELHSEVEQLRHENERLSRRTQQLERLLALRNISLPSSSSSPPSTSPIASTQSLSIALLPMDEEEKQQQQQQQHRVKEEKAQQDAASPPAQRMTRSRTRNSLSQPALLRESTADALLKELSQHDREGRSGGVEDEEKDGTGKKRKKLSAGERTIDKKVRQTDGSSTSQQSSTALTAEVEELLDQARAEKEKGSAEFERGLRGYPQALEHYQDALELLAPVFPSPTAVSSYPAEVADLCASLHHKIGVVHNKRGDFDAACDQFDAALHWQPGWWRLWKALGYSEFARKRYPQALKALEHALQCGVEERKDRVDLEEKIELARSIINKLTTPLPQPQRIDLSPCRSPIPKAQPTTTTTSTATPARLAGKLDRADGRQPLGEVTNTAGPASLGTAPSSSQPGKAHSSDRWLQLPLITKDGIRDLLGRETFVVAGELHESKRFVQFMLDKGGLVRGRSRQVDKKRTRLIEQMCRFEGDKCVEYSCQCMEGMEKDEAGEMGRRPPQGKVRVEGSGEEAWRYAACEHIGAMLLTLQAKQQQALLHQTADKENAAASMTPSKRLALTSSQPTLYVSPAHRLSAADEQRDRSLAVYYEAMKQEQLKALLKANDSKTSANVKAELVARCVEEELWGVPEKCTVCRYGNMYYAGGVWRCRGMFDKEKKQYVRCDHVAKDWPTRPWRRL